MKLTEILRAQPGEYVWLFTRNSSTTTIGDAHRRVQSALARPPHDRVKVSCKGVILTDTNTYDSEPALVIEVIKQPKR